MQKTTGVLSPPRRHTHTGIQQPTLPVGPVGAVFVLPLRGATKRPAPRQTQHEARTEGARNTSHPEVTEKINPSYTRRRPAAGVEVMLGSQRGLPAVVRKQCSSDCGSASRDKKIWPLA